jgi:hypothetical protein
MEQKIRCKHCHRSLSPNPRVKNHQYCSRKTCQQARKTQWQCNKMATDADYRKNQVESLENWREHNRDYWRRYRDSHEDYRDRNRRLQKVRDARRRARRLAKMDASKRKNDVMPGAYYIVPIKADLAKKDVSIQKIFIIPDICSAAKTNLAKKDSMDIPRAAGVRCGTKEGADHDVYPALPGSGP